MSASSICILTGALLIATVAGCAPTTIAPAIPAATASSPLTATPIAPTTPASAEEEAEMDGEPISTPFDPALQRIINHAIDDLATRLTIDIDQIELVDARSITWPDGSLGCPKAGMAYIQVQVDGLLLRLKAGGRMYEYHGGGSRPPFLCEQTP